MRTQEERPAVRWMVVAALGALALLVVVLASTLGLEFVADDYSHLFEDADQPWYYSQDHLYRPLRNACFRILPRLLGTAPGPYRLLQAGLYLAMLGLLLCLLRRQGVGLAGALGAVAVVALFPRNQRVLFWFAAAQDLVVACGVLSAACGWEAFRARGSRSGYALALVAAALALGFKEPAVVTPGLLLLLDGHRERLRWSRLRAPDFWRPYLGFVPALCLYAAFVLTYRQGRLLLPPDVHDVYGTGGGVASALALVRTGVNLALPFSVPLRLRDVDGAHAGLVLGLGVSVALLAWRTGSARRVAFGLAWVLLASVPTSVFASRNAGDQYLLLPLLGLGWALAQPVDVLARARAGRLQPAVAALVLLFAALGARSLLLRAAEWRRAGEVVRATRESALHLGLQADVARAWVVAGVPHSRVGPAGLVPILNNGLRGLLLSAGYRRELALTVLHAPQADTASRTQPLLRALQGCAPEAGARITGTRVLLWEAGTLQDRSGVCARTWWEDLQRLHEGRLPGPTPG